MKDKKNWMGMILLTGCLALFFVIAGSRDISHAADMTGIVTASSLNVRSGAGTANPVLTTLPVGTKVTLLETVTVSESDKWYRIQVTVDGQVKDGYVSASYIAIETEATASPAPTPSSTVPTVTYRNETTYKPISVAGKILSKTKVYKKNGKTQKVIAKKKVVLAKNKSVKVVGEKILNGKKWFTITFKSNKKTQTGYVQDIYVKMTLKKAAPAEVNSVKKKIKLYSKADTKSAYKKSGNKTISLAKGTEVSIIKDVKKKNVKWYKLSFSYGNKTKTGYVKAAYVTLIRQKKVTKVPVTALSSEEFEKSLTQQGFPDLYKQKLRVLHQKYPYWQFVAYKTNLDWKTVIENESKLGVNLISNSKSKAWKSMEPGAYDAKTGKWIAIDGSTWVAASREAISYYMDPRNFLTERTIFMFEALEYQSQYQTKAGVDTILNNTPLSGNFNYTDPATGAAKTITYTNAFMAAAKQSGVSPYHLASRVKQEVVTSATTISGAVTGTDKNYPSIYNFYNIGAFSSSNPIQNGLKWASGGEKGNETTYLRPWTDRYRSIVGGGMYIGTSYIGRGQNTGYLQKFNVTSYQRYEHQYMTNVEAAYSEAMKTKTAYADTMDQTPIIFSIPVYNNMPATACPAPQ